MPLHCIPVQRAYQPAQRWRVHAQRWANLGLCGHQLLVPNGGRQGRRLEIETGRVNGSIQPSRKTGTSWDDRNMVLGHIRIHNFAVQHPSHSQGSMIESEDKVMEGSRRSEVVHWADEGLFQSAKPPHTAPRDCM